MQVLQGRLSRRGITATTSKISHTNAGASGHTTVQPSAARPSARADATRSPGKPGPLQGLVRHTALNVAGYADAFILPYVQRIEKLKGNYNAFCCQQVCLHTEEEIRSDLLGISRTQCCWKTQVGVVKHLTQHAKHEQR